MNKKVRIGKRLMMGLLGCLLVFNLTGVLALTGACAQSKTKLTWWQKNVPVENPYRKYHAEVLKKFHAKYPNIQIEYVLKVAKNFDYIITMASAAKEGPDFFQFWAGPPTRDWAKRGDILPLDGLFSEEKFNSTSSMSVVTIDGKVYALPLRSNFDALMYNKEAFKKAGLDPDIFPRYEGGFFQVLEALKASGTNPIAWADKQGYSSDFYMEGLITQNFDSIEDIVESLMTGKGSFTDPRYLRGLARWKELYDKGFLFRGGMAEPWATYTSQLIGGKAAIGRGNPNFYIPIAKETGPIWGLAQYPIYREHGKLADTVMIFPGAAWYITSYSKYPSEAALAIELFTHVENCDLFYELGCGIPTNMNWDFEGLVKDPELIKMMKTILRKPGTDLYVLYPSEGMWNVVVKNISLYLLGEITAEEYAKRLDEARIEAEE